MDEIEEAVEGAGKRVAEDTKREGYWNLDLLILNEEKASVRSLLKWIGTERLRKIAKSSNSLEEFMDGVKSEVLGRMPRRFLGGSKEVIDPSALIHIGTLNSGVGRTALEILYNKYQKRGEGG